MNFRRNLLLSSLAALTLGTTGVHAQDNVLRVGTDATFPPMEYVDNGKRTGFDIELVEAIGKTLGRKVEWVDIDFKGLVPGLISKRFDMAVSAIYITDERKKVVDFTIPYYAGGLVVMVEIGRADAAVTGKPAAYQYVRTRPGLKVLPEQITTEEYGMAIRKDSPELTKAINGAIEKLKADGTYAAIVNKWFSNNTAK